MLGTGRGFNSPQWSDYVETMFFRPLLFFPGMVDRNLTRTKNEAGTDGKDAFNETEGFEGWWAKVMALNQE